MNISFTIFRQEDLEDQEKKERRAKQMKKNIKLMAIALIVLGSTLNWTKITPSVPFKEIEIALEKHVVSYSCNLKGVYIK